VSFSHPQNKDDILSLDLYRLAGQDRLSKLFVSFSHPQKKDGILSLELYRLAG